MEKVYGPETLDDYTKRTLQELSEIDFKKVIRYAVKVSNQFKKFDLPETPEDKAEIFRAVTTILNLARISNIKEQKAEYKQIDEILEGIKPHNLSKLEQSRDDMDCVVSICGLLSRDTAFRTSERKPLPLTGGNLGVWVGIDNKISFTGNRRYDVASDFLNSKAKEINLKVNNSQ